MKFVLLILAICLAGCARPAVSTDSGISSNQTTPAANIQTNVPNDEEHAAKLAEAEKQNAPFKIAPPHFAKTDFANFTYPTDYPKRQVTLKNGEFEYEDPKHPAGGWFSFGEAFFTDLTGDGVQEAIIFLSRVDCGASCNGGAYLIYIYGTEKNRPKLLWNLETGPYGGDCGLKEFKIDSKKLVIDVFSSCDEKMEQSKDFQIPVSLGKFGAYGFTRFVFNFDGKTFKPLSREFFDVGELSARNYQSLIRIS